MKPWFTPQLSHLRCLLPSAGSRVRGIFRPNANPRSPDRQAPACARARTHRPDQQLSRLDGGQSGSPLPGAAERWLWHPTGGWTAIHRGPRSRNRIKVKDFPDTRFRDHRRKRCLWVSPSAAMASICTLPWRRSRIRRGSESWETPGSWCTRLRQGTSRPSGSSRLRPSRLPTGNWVAPRCQKVEAGSAIPYPAGLAVVAVRTDDRLLVADNLSDNVDAGRHRERAGHRAI